MGSIRGSGGGEEGACQWGVSEERTRDGEDTASINPWPQGLIPHRHPLPVLTSLVCDRVHTLHTAIVAIVSETTATSTFYPPHPHLYYTLSTPLEMTVQPLQDYDLDKNTFTYAPDGRPSIQEECQSLDSVQTSFASSMNRLPLSHSPNREESFSALPWMLRYGHCTASPAIETSERESPLFLPYNSHPSM
jgi:hypothetical protein